MTQEKVFQLFSMCQALLVNFFFDCHVWGRPQISIYHFIQMIDVYPIYSTDHFFILTYLLFRNFVTENFFRRAEKKCCGYWITLTRNARLCHARSGKVGSSHCYLDRRPLHEMETFDEIVYEYDKNILNKWYTLHYQL